jgi:hypothetical protein
VLVLGEPEGGSKVVTGTALILVFEALVLFDSGATHFFISIVFVGLSRLVVRTLELGLVVTTPVGKIVVCKRVVCECPISICGRILPANLVALPMFSYGVILRMDWLMRHLAIIDYAQKQVTLTPWGEGTVMYVRSRARSLPPTILTGLGSLSSEEVKHFSLSSIRCRSNEASKEESGRHSCGVRVSKCLFDELL